METELWYTPETPYIKNRVRMAYPGIMKVIELEPKSGEIILKKEFNDVVTQGKYRGVQLNNKKYIYMPGDRGFQEEWSLDEKPLAREAIRDAELLSLKFKLLDLFQKQVHHHAQRQDQGTDRLESILRPFSGPAR